jgi:hypothetical protein
MENQTPYVPKNKVRIVTAASLFDGHDAAINIMRRIIQSTGCEVIHLGHDRSVEEVVNTAIQEDANKQVQTARSFFEAANMASQKLSRIPTINMSNLTWRGKTLFPNNHRREYTIKEGNNLLFGLVSRDGRKNVAVTQRDIFQFGNTVRNDGKLNVLIHKHKGKKPDVRAAQRIAAAVNVWETFLWVRTDDSTTEADIKNFLAQFGDAVHVTYVKDLPDPGPTSKSANRTVKVKTWTTSSRHYPDYDMPDEDFKKGGLYVETVGSKLVKHPYKPDAVYDPLYHCLSNIDARLGNLIRVPKTVVQDFKDAPQWVEANTVAIKLLSDCQDGIAESLLQTIVRNQPIFEKLKDVVLPDMELPSDVKDLLDKFSGKPQFSGDLRNYLPEKVKLEMKKKATDITRVLEEKYKLLVSTNVYRWSSKEVKQAAIEYIQMVDLMQKMSQNHTTQAA